MPTPVHRCGGSCHCGAIAVELDLSQPPSTLRLRACQCSFCRRRATRTLADSGGRARIRVKSPDLMQRYRFGLKTADYLLCATCGTYVGAILDAGDGLFAVINVAGLDIPEFQGSAASPVDYDAETVEERVKRRRSTWMPVHIAIAGTGP
jgi:hypothetical protein